jgi:drug/metabolite transporter (DMT)-like permease
MLYLLAVSLLWGFSFGLVKAEFSSLSGETLAMMRMLIALPCFLPFLKPAYRQLNKLNLQLLLTGAIQYGLMYVCLFSAFKYLSGYEVALMTIFTPLFVVLADAILQKRIPPAWFWTTAFMAVAGALWIFSPQSLPDKLPGILLMQLANLCFALGQVAWRTIRKRHPELNDLDGYALLYLGALLLTIPFALPQGPVCEVSQLSGSQWMALLYLGSIASGVGFFLWNAGAVRVNPASLAVFNNLKIPIATVISIFVFGESASPGRLVPGLVIMVLALIWAERAHRNWITSRG